MPAFRPTLNRTIIHFALRFFFIFLASQLLLEFVNLFFFQQFLASLVGMVLHVPVNGIYIPLNASAQFEISAFCTGITSAAMLVGLLVGFRLPPLREKILYSVLGGGFILLVNVLRLLLVVQVGFFTQDVAAAEFAHTLTWFAMSWMVLGIWYHGMKRATRSKNGNELARKLME